MSGTIKKVYDRYMGSDFTVGTSNLNPKREIKRDDKEIVRKIRERVQEIKTTLDKVPVEINPTVEVGLGKGVQDNMSTTQAAAIINAGGEESILYMPSTNGDELTVLEAEVERMLLSLSSRVDIDLDQTLNCDGIEYDDLVDAANSSGSKSLNSSSSNGSGSSGSSSSDDTSGDSGSSGDGSGDSSDDTDSSSDEDSTYNQEETTAEIEQETEEDNADLESCAIQQLEFLKVIIIILKIINLIKKILQLILEILVPLIKIISRIATSWTAPPNALEAIQLIVEKITAILQSLLAYVLQALWDSLNADCLTEATQSALDELNSAIAGISAIYAGSGDVVNFFSKETWNQLTDPFDGITDTWNEGAKKWKELGAGLVDQNAWKEQLSATYGSQSIKSTLSAAIPSSAKTAWKNAITTAASAATTLASAAMSNSSSENSAKVTATARKVISTLQNLKVL